MFTLLSDLADEVTTSLKQAAVTMPKPLVNRVLGVNTTSMDARRHLFWRDLAAFCDEFWSMSISWKTQAFGHLAFNAQGGGGGTSLTVLITSGSDDGALNVVMDVTKGKEQETYRHSFPSHIQIQDIIYALDEVSQNIGWKWA